MFGSKRREIANLKRLLRIQAGKLADTEEDLRAARHVSQTAARLYAEDDRGQQLERALEDCAQARADEAKVTARLAVVQQAYDHAVGLDSPAYDADARWQERRPDKVKGAAL